MSDTATTRPLTHLQRHRRHLVEVGEFVTAFPLGEHRRGQREGLVTTDIAAPMLLRMLTELARSTAVHASAGPAARIGTQRSAVVLAAQRLVGPVPTELPDRRTDPQTVTAGPPPAGASP